MTVEAAFLREVDRFGRRLRRVRLARAIPINVAIVFIGVGATTLVAPPTVSPALLWSGAAAGTVVMSVLAERIQRRARSEIARQLDARLDLANRVTTALQFAAAPDPVSHLVVQDAQTSLSRRTPREIPFEIAPAMRWLIPAAFIAVLMSVAMSRTGSAGDGQSRQSAIFLPRASAGSAASLERPTGQNGALDRPTRSDAPDSSGAPAVSAAVSSSNRSSESSSAAGSPGASAAADGRNDLTGQPTSPSAMPESAPNSSAANRGSRGNGSTVGGATGGSRGAGNGQATQMGTAAGGVQGGPHLDQRPAQSVAQSLEARREIARRRATYYEAAVTAQRVPAHLRNYVRDYFIALRSTEAAARR